MNTPKDKLCVVDYVEKEEVGFEALPFNARDAVAFCQLPYLHLPQLVPKFANQNELDDFFRQEPSWDEPSPIGEDVGASKRKLHAKSFLKERPAPIKKLLKRELYPGMSKGVANAELCLDLIRAMGESPRFRNVMLSNVVEPGGGSPERFCALSADLGNGILVVAFRGTDTTIRSWKDNYEMGIFCPVHSQKTAASYLSQVLKTWHGSIVLAGHSKGGNLAIYAASACPKEVQDRVLAVYSLDGPGFNRDFLESPGFKRIERKIHKIVPEFSVIGSLLNSDVKRLIVKSNVSGIKQHFPITWQFDKDLQFSTSDKISPLANYIVTSFNEWIGKYDSKERKVFVDTFFDSLLKAGYVDFGELLSDPKATLSKLHKQFKNLPADTREAMTQFFQDLANVAFLQLPVIKSFAHKDGNPEPKD